MIGLVSLVNSMVAVILFYKSTDALNSCTTLRVGSRILYAQMTLIKKVWLQRNGPS